MKLELTIEETYDFLKFQLQNIKKLQKKVQKAEAKTSKQQALNIANVMGSFKDKKLNELFNYAKNDYVRWCKRHNRDVDNITNWKDYSQISANK